MKHHPAGVNTFCLRRPRKSLGWRGSQISSILTCGLTAHLPASAFLCWELTPSSWCDLGEESSFFRGEWVALKPVVYKIHCKLRGRGQQKPSRAVCVDTPSDFSLQTEGVHGAVWPAGRLPCLPQILRGPCTVAKNGVTKPPVGQVKGKCCRHTLASKRNMLNAFFTLMLHRG